MMVLRTVLVAPFGSQWLYMFNASTAQAGTWYDGRFFARTAFCSAFRRCHKKKNHTFSPSSLSTYTLSILHVLYRVLTNVFFSAKRRLWRKKLRHYIRTLLCSSTWEVSSCAYKEEGECSSNSMYICRETGGFKVDVAVFCRLCCVPVSLRIHHCTSSNRVM